MSWKSRDSQESLQGAKYPNSQILPNSVACQDEILQPKAIHPIYFHSLGSNPMLQNDSGLPQGSLKKYLQNEAVVRMEWPVSTAQT